MKFVVRFFGPMRVGTGMAAPGVDLTLDVENLLPASSTKGLMREAARRLFGNQLVCDVFGGGGRSSPWGWCDAVFDTPPRITRRVRIAIGPEGVTDDNKLFVQQEAWADQATFEVEQILPVPATEVQRHECVLTAAAHSIHALGGDRRRGLGWVGVSLEDKGRAERLLEHAWDLL